MPKKKDESTTAPAGAKPDAPKKEAAPKKKTIFKFTGNEPKEGCKLAPQAQGIVNILKEAGKDGLSREDLVAAMVGVISTKQPESRILAYYQKKLVESGTVEMVEE